MFNHAGRKIRILAIIAFVLCVCASIFGGVYYMLTAYTLEAGISYIQIAYGWGVILGGIFFSYLATLFLVAFGELVESTTCNMEINEEILDLMEKKEKKEAAAAAQPAQVPVQAYAPYQPYYAPYQAPVQPVAPVPVQPAPVPEQPVAEPVAPVTEPVVAEHPVVPVVDPETWFCTSCGTKNNVESAVCANCGKEKV